MAIDPPSTEWREQIAGDEDARFTRHAEALRALQRKRAKGGAGRALHKKGHAGVTARFEVLGDLPAEARQGLFARPGSYPAYVRFSNGAGTHQADRTGDVRGLAIKVVGVAGKKVIPGLEDAATQDFLLIQSATTPFRGADEFVKVVLATTSVALALPRLIWAVGPKRTFGLARGLRRSLAVPVPSLASQRLYSALPVRWGAYAGKYALFPVDPAADPAVGTDRHYLASELAARLAGGELRWDFAVQLYRDEARTPIEDASGEWREADAPFVKVGRLVIPRQDPASQRGVALAAVIERMSFDPWHALVEHRPLGEMMRARNHAYRLSTAERGVSAEPDGTESFAP